MAEAAESEHEDTPADGATIADCPQETSSTRSKKKKKKKKKHKNEQTKDESIQQNGTVSICRNVDCILIVFIGILQSSLLDVLKLTV